MVALKVFPVETLPGHVFKVSLVDALVPMVWVKQVLFWPIGKPTEYEQASEYLREGLSRLITEIPALAGNLSRHGQAAPRDISITINENAFVEFTSRDATRSKSASSYDELERNGFPIGKLGKGFFPKASSEPVVEGTSMFCAQLSHIRGGAVLAFCFNHVLTDGLSGSEIERIWAAHTSDVAEGIAFHRYKVATPDEQIRRQLSTPKPPPSDKKVGGDSGGLSSITRVFSVEETFSYLHKNLRSFRTAVRKVVFALLKRLIVTGDRLEPRSLAIWNFSPDKLAQLKQTASDANSENWISTNDALCGLFWSRTIAVERQKKSDVSRTSTLLFPLSIRKRLDPNVPDEYVGNVVASTIARCDTADLSGTGDHGVRIAAQSLRRANTAWSESSFHSSQNAVLSLPQDKAFGLDRDFLFDRSNLHYNDHSSFKSNTLDWGSTLGVVARTRYPNPGLSAGAPTVFVHPRLPDGGLEVSLTCTQEIRRALDADGVFSRYATFVCQDPLPSQNGMRYLAMMVLWWGFSSLGRLYWWREVKEFRQSRYGSKNV